MKEKYRNILTVSLFCGFLGGMLLLYLLLPGQEFSPREKRFLAEPPSFTPEAVLSGEWGSQAESYLADHMPGRDFFVGLNAYFEALTGRQKTKDIWTSEGRLLEAPKVMDSAAVDKNIRSIHKMQEKTEAPVDLMLIPSAGWYCGLSQYQDDRIIQEVYRKAGENIRTLSLNDCLTGEDFYRTDHHWTSEGAWRAYCAYAESLGMEPVREFKKEQISGFRGSTYARSGLWLTPGEPITLYEGSPDLTVEIGEETYDSLFFRENLQGADPYTVFLGGNHPLVRIHNPRKSGKLLVIRDSFSNCLGGFLAESFGQVTLVDLRYYKQPMSRLLQEDFDRILVIYSLSNFLTDQNLVFLQR